VQHPDPDDLALIALGESLGEAVDTHVADCPQCFAEVESLRLTVGLADLSNFGEDAARPGEHVWQAIAAELGFGAERAGAGVATVYGESDDSVTVTSAQPATGLPREPRTTSDQGPSTSGSTANGGSGSNGGSASSGPSDATVRTAAVSTAGTVPPPALRAVPGTGTPTAPGSPADSLAKRRRRWVTPVAAAVIGIAVGAGAVVIAQNRTDEVTVEATAPLTPVPGGPLSGDQQLGEAEIVAAGNGQQVRVQAADLPATTNDYEVWLFGNDGKMVSLGTLNDGSGTFTVPQGISTQEYRVVDVSDEPPDGVPTHSGVSLVRGQFS